MPDDVSLEEHLDKAKEAVGSLPADTLRYAIAAVVALIVLYIVYKLLRRKRKAPVKGVADLSIDVTSLDSEGPPAGAAVLEFFNVPVRLAALILAPAGRVRELPSIDQLDDVFEAILPGLSKVVATHKPLLRRWPAQVSSRGFAHAVFQHCRLPGDGGKGTPWCAAAGGAKLGGQPVMAGLIMRTESASGHGQQIIDAEEKWLGCLRVKQ